ncbi:MAG: 2-oxoglutarate dehydrogenase E1 component [Acidobacteriota bacterium]
MSDSVSDPEHPASAVADSNIAFVEELYASYLEDPHSVDVAWRDYFAEIARDDGDNWAAQRAVHGPSFRRASIFSPPTANAAPVPILTETTLPRFSGEALAGRLRYLRRIKMFRQLPAEELALVARLGVEERFDDGDVLFREGDPGDALYLLTDGHLLIRRRGRLIATLNPGEVVGELAVLDELPRSADVVAHGPARVVRVDRADFLALLDTRPALARAITQMLAMRLRRRSSRQDRVNQLIHAYRVRGHLLADLDPLGSPSESIPELELERYGLSEGDLDSLFSTTALGSGTQVLTLQQILELLRATYCGAIGVQFMHIDDLRAKSWLIEHLEDKEHHRELSRDEQLRILTKLTDAEIFEQFIHKKFLGAKRFSLEGAETLIPLLDLALETAHAHGIEETVIGMAHRGRLNVLVNIMGKSAAEVFREFADEDPERFQGAGDVKYHLGYSSNRSWDDASAEMHLSLCFNPSHLEFVNPVLMGRVRAKQDRYRDFDHQRCLGIAIHGDAAFSGQGVTQEMLNMAELHGYRTGGTLHIIVNNQIGFTTAPDDGRSTHYATDVARMLQTPVFHVNGEDPDAVAHVVRLAMEYRREFGTDVIIDMYCYRRHGHNEGDEPSYTQPLLYERIRKHPSVREAYLERLLGLRGVTRADAKEIQKRRQKDLQGELEQSQKPGYKLRGPSSGEGLWQPYRGGRDADVRRIATAVPEEKLKALLRRLCHVPDEFALHKKLRRFLDERLKMAGGEKALDWGTAEALAFASLVVEGHRVRMSGQDSGRGTFSHRHAVFYDETSGEQYVPLQHLTDDQARFQIYDSPLSEIGVLGFEYGYSLDTPDGLTLWEAQFGDFCNVAQVIIDQFITSGEDKWGRLSGLVMLLPHGFEGQGPEHSSARLERFLNLCAEDNIQVVNLTTPAQVFHVLRRQVLRPLRKPLIVMSPKSLLRLPAATSTLDELTHGSFRRIIEDPREQDPASVQRILLTSGKIYYELVDARAEAEREDVAILRLEQYYPLDVDLLRTVLDRYADGTPVLWVQEEPRNMGAWSFLKLRLSSDGMLFGRWPVSCVSRPESASPATGSATAHKQEQKALLLDALG